MNKCFCVMLLGACLLKCIAAEYSGAQDNLNIFAQPIATTVQLPTFGVSFDADGVLQMNTFTDPTGQVVAQRLAAARAALPGNLARPTAMRKVSLVRLERDLGALLAAGKVADDVMKKLAGLTRISAVFCYPKMQDIVIAGPAEPWIEDLSGKAVGIHTGRPTLLLADLAVALRAYRPGAQQRGFVGCTISPQQEGLERLVQFQRKIPRAVPQNRRQQVSTWVSDGVRERLGMAIVQVFGVSPRTHFARVMIEADYRMKRIAVGAEPPPVRMTTFAAALTTAGHGTLERWWFTPSYSGLLAAPDRLAFKITGQGVQLNTENKAIQSDGTIVDAGRKPTRATKAYATSFTEKYDEIAEVAPVYAQLRQLTDDLIVAAFLRQHDWYGQTGWDAAVLLDEQTFPVQSMNNPAAAPVVVRTFWKGQRMFTPAGGGVSIVAENALAEMIEDQSLNQDRKVNRPAARLATWWWD